MDSRDKIQHLLITYLLEKGYIELSLPDGLTVELGIVQEGKDGHLHKTDDYSWVIANQKNRTVSMDSYTFGLRYLQNDGKIIVEEEATDQEGQPMKVLMAC
jgi:hypothetical protein